MSARPRKWADVLIVEPNPSFRHYLLSVIASERHIECRSAVGTIAEAIEKLAEVQPDVVLLGASVSGQAGVQWVKKIREAKGEAKLLAISIQHSPSYANQMLLAGADGFMAMEDLDGLCDAIRDILRGAIYISERVFESSGSGLDTVPCPDFSLAELEQGLKIKTPDSSHLCPAS